MRYLLFLILSSSLIAQPMDWEKINEKLKVLKEELKEKHHLASNAYYNNAPEDELKKLLSEVQCVKQSISEYENQLRKESAENQPEEEYAIWDLGEVTLSEFILEFGSTDYLYVIPSELGGLKLHFYSTISIARSSWNEVVDLILSSNGIGVKKINSFTKVLYLYESNPSLVDAICSKPQDLLPIDSSSRIFYLLAPPPGEQREVEHFFERFADPKEVVVYHVSSLIALIGPKENITRLLDLYAAIWQGEKKKKELSLVPLKKLSTDEAKSILHAYFPHIDKKNKDYEDLQVMELPQGLVLLGEKRSVEKAQMIVQDLEDQLSLPEEKTIYWYTCKHSSPEALSQTLEKVYASLTENQKNYHPRKFGKTSARILQNKEKEHFIVDSKTGSLCMVLKKDEVKEIESLLKKLDVPKKMVQIDVLLVEKKHQERGQSGINLLQLGAHNKKPSSQIHFDADERGYRKGILDFIFSFPKAKHCPSFDLTYSFLMAQENVKINANPSILAINQTPATISIVEEISINNGAVHVESGNKVAMEKSFTRAQYGTTLVLTPTIHLADPTSGETGFITLVTDITFDTTQTSTDDRPPVTKRHIENEVRIADGETIILGGLKRSSSEESSEKIPFLGEIPGIGKLFSSSHVSDTNTEMFIFITPHIIKDPIGDLNRVRMQELEKRPGDIPDFLNRLNQAKSEEKKKLFEESLRLLFQHSDCHASTRHF